MLLENQPKRSQYLNRSSLSILIVAGSLMGCSHEFISARSTAHPYVHKMDDFLPLDSGQKETLYTVDGTKTNYSLKTKKDGSSVHFQAISEGKVIDEEVYDVQNRTILLKEAVGENFLPPITLIEFPLEVGSQYQWKGKLACELNKIDGSATVLTSTDFVSLKDKSEDAIKVEVNLSFGSGGNRKLSFWFVKGQGILKTEMVKTIREPKQ